MGDSYVRRRGGGLRQPVDERGITRLVGRFSEEGASPEDAFSRDAFPKDAFPDSAFAGGFENFEREAFGTELHADSLERTLLGEINPDSLKRAVRLRFDRDSLTQRMRRMERRADSVARRFAEQFREDFDREAFEERLDVDSLRRWHEHHADSLRRHLEQLREQWTDEMPERFREQARRLREQAEELEERAEKMEERLSPPPESSASELAAASGPEEEYTYRFVLEDFRVQVDGRVIEDGGLSMRGNGYFWIRGPKAVYVFAAQPFDGATRVGAYRDRDLSVTVGGHDVEVRSASNRPIYVEDGAPAYGARIPLTDVTDDVSKAGIGTRLSTIGSRFAPTQ